MAKYGTNVYGDGSLYGSSNITFIDLDASPVVAVPFGYRTIQITWNEPTGSWTQLALVRNPFGFPVNYDDGVVVYQAPYAASSYSFVDYGQDSEGSSGLSTSLFYHYAVFLQVGNGTWQRAGTAYSLCVQDYKTSEFMYNLVPSVYKSSTLNTLSRQDQNSNLESFFDVLSFELDRVKTYTQIITNSTSSSEAFTPMIPSILEQYGSKYEPELGVQSGRVYIKNAARIGRDKGSVAGLTDFLKSYSQYDQNIKMGKNLFLDYNDSSFEESIGNWSAGTLNTTTGVWSPTTGYLDAYLTTRVPTKNAYVVSNAPTLYPNRVAGFLEVQTTGTGTTAFACGADTPTLKGIPVIGGDAYTFSAWTAAATTSRTVKLYVIWYTLYGKYISQSSSSSQTNAVWSSSNPWPTRVYNTVTAPANAVFAVPYIEITGGNTQEYHYFDALQFEQGSQVTTFEDSRMINITMVAQRINEILDPSFVNTAATYAVTNGTFTQDNTHIASTGGTESLAITATETTLSTYTANAVGTKDEYTVTVTDVVTLQVLCIGMDVSGTGLPSETEVLSIDYGTGVVTLNNALTANINASLTFTSYPVTVTTAGFMPVLPGYWYTMSGYVRTGYTGSIAGDWYGRFEVDWYDSNHDVIYTDLNYPRHLTDYYDIGSFSITAGRMSLFPRTDTFDIDVGDNIVLSGLSVAGSDVSGTYAVTYADDYVIEILVSAPTTPVTQLPTVDAVIVQELVSNFEQWHDSYISPPTAAYAKSRFAWVNAEAGQKVWVDNFMFERSSAVNNYFDGGEGFSVTTDLLWEGAPNNSRSHYYRNLKAVEQRLINELPYYLPNGSSFQILVAQPGTL